MKLKKSFIQMMMISALLISFTSCSDDDEDNNNVNEADPIDFTIQPSAELDQIVSNTPSDFTWGFYEDNLTIGLNPEPESFSGEVMMSAFELRNGNIMNSLSSQPVSTNLQELSAGLSTEDMYPGSMWIEGTDWLPSMQEWEVSEVWYPGSMWAPSEIKNIAMQENNLADNETMIVVYPELTSTSDREVVSQPYGIIFQSQDADPIDFTIQPSAELDQIISNTPNDFTWGFYEDNLSIGLNPEPESFNGDVMMSAFELKNGDIINSFSSQPVSTNLQELSDGLSTEDMYPGSQWINGNDWLPSMQEWDVSEVWYPGSQWAPSEIESIAMQQNSLADNETMIVVYPQLPATSDREVVSQPYGIIFQLQ